MWELETIENDLKLRKWFKTNGEITTKQHIYKNFNINQQIIDNYTIEIVKWCQNTPELPQESQDRKFIEIMLQRNKYQFERTKMKISHYFQTIPKFSEIFANLGNNRLSNEVSLCLPLPKPTGNFERIVIFTINTKIGRVIDIKQAILTIVTVATFIFHYDHALRVRFILDFRNFEFMQFLKIRPNIIFIFLEILERILSMSIAGIEIINSPFYVNVILALFKMTMKPKLLNRITVHKNLDSLHKTIPQGYLPVGYGSDPVEIDDLCVEFDGIIQNSCEFYEKIAKFTA